MVESSQEKGVAAMTENDKQNKTSPNHYVENTDSIIQGVNWNEIPDPRDKEVWDRVTSNFWLPEKVPVSNDLKSWATLTDAEKTAAMRVFTGLTVLDTIQGTVGATAVMQDATTMHEEAVYANFSFMEALTADMMVYSQTGWKSIADVVSGEDILQYNPDHGGCHFVPAQVVAPHRAKYTYVISDDSGKFIQHVSPGHRVAFVDDQGVMHTATADELAENRDKFFVEKNHLIIYRHPDAETTPARTSMAYATIGRREGEDVFCVQVDSTYLVVKHADGGMPVVSGNCVHAKSYSNIFMTLASTEEINEAFRWSEYNEHLQNKSRMILDLYRTNDPFKRKIASVALESFLFYSGFYLPLRFATRGKLTNTADIIRLIIRDECLSGDHDVLTPQGWVPIADVTKDTLVAQYEKGGTISFVRPNVISTHEVPWMWEFIDSTGRVDMQCSPSHRIPLVDDNGNISVVTAEEYDIAEVSGGIPVAAHSGSGGNDDPTHSQRLSIASRLAGYVEDQGEKTSVIFGFDDQEKMERIAYLANTTDHDVSMVKNIDETRIETLSIADAEDIVSGNMASLDDVTNTWCREYIDEVAYWNPDGGFNDGVMNVTTTTGYADYLQSVATLAGFECQVSNQGYTTVVTIRDNNSGLVDVGGVSKRKTAGGTVYGIEVDSGMIVTRRNGIVTMTGNSVHGYYIGYKYQVEIAKEDQQTQDYYKDLVMDLLADLYDVESQYTEEIYDEIGWTEDVKTFLRYNANKALNNLGYEGIFPEDTTQVAASILSSLAPEGDENHDFFSGSGSTYTIGEAEDTEDDDWDW